MPVSNNDSLNSLPLISIIVVTLNAEKYINNTIKSILDQDFNSFEIIVIDGESKDSTLNILESFNSSISKCISEKDSGIYDAMNKGIINSVGSWVIFMNAGDIFFNSKVLSQTSKYLLNVNFDVVYGDYSLYSKSIIRQPKVTNRYFFFSHTICHQTAFIRRSVFKKIGLHNLDYKIISDRDFFYRAFINNINFLKISIPICFWDSIGFSSNNHKLYLNEIYDFRNTNFLVTQKVTIWVKKVLKYINYYVQG